MLARRSFALLALLALGGLASICSAQAPVPNAPAKPAVDDGYRVGSEDIVSVTVMRHPEFSGDFLVPQSGIVQIPVVGAVHVGGMSLGEIQRLVTATLADTRLWKPEVTVTLKFAGQKRVYVVGDVKLSGAYDWKPGWTIAQLLGSSGGLNPDIPQNDVQLVLEHASGAPATTMPLPIALSKPDDPSLQILPGDTLRVESILTIPVYVTGRVSKPGLYRLRTDASNVLAAVSEAGGANGDASLVVRIQHSDGKEETVDLAPSLVLGKKIDVPSLRSGDMVIVSENLNRFTVLGYVSRSGSYVIPDGHIYRLTDAIAAAADTSGPGTTAEHRGRISRIGVVRVVNNKPVRKVYDLSKYLRNGDESQNPVVLSGDIIYVPQSNGVELTTSLAAISTGAILYYNFTH